MRQDQFERLQVLSEQLTDVFLDEADPNAWSGAQTPMAEWTQQQRGDRYWEKRNAVATMALIGRVVHLCGVIQHASNAGAGAAAVDESQGLLDDEIKAAEKDAKRLLNKLEQSIRKKEFDKRVHGAT